MSKAEKATILTFDWFADAIKIAKLHIDRTSSISIVGRKKNKCGKDENF